MERNVLKEIIERHLHYLNEDVEGWEAMCADLHGAVLSGADLSDAVLHGAVLSDAVLSGADLHGAVLRDAVLRCADLHGADLSCADLSCADLSCADLYGADLRGADLHGADLSCADLHGAVLYDAVLRDADLRGADLRGADLHGAVLYGADLYGADLRGADLHGADLRGAVLSDAVLSDDEEYRRGVILSKPIIGWKKCADDIIVELEIPEGSIVFSINGKKCRTNKAKCVSISNGNVAKSVYDSSFKYEVGKEYELNNFNLMYNVECGTGIHFFKTREEAENY